VIIPFDPVDLLDYLLLLLKAKPVCFIKMAFSQVVMAFLELHFQSDKVHNMIEVVPMYHTAPMMNKDEK
jgi:membrane glycosyltransferase